MKKFVALFIGITVGAACLIGCTQQEEAFVAKSYTADQAQITGVYIDVQDRQIEVSLSADHQIHIGYFENSKEYYDISVSDDQLLTMTAASNKDWTDYIGVKSAAGSRKISLQLPNVLLETLKLSTTNEEISLAALYSVGDLSLSSQGGNIRFDRLNVGNAIHLNAKNGDITGTMIGSYDDYAISCDTKKGESNLPASKENGTKTLAVSNNNGNVDIQFISA